MAPPCARPYQAKAVSERAPSAPSSTRAVAKSAPSRVMGDQATLVGAGDEASTRSTLASSTQYRCGQAPPMGRPCPKPVVASRVLSVPSPRITCVSRRSPSSSSAHSAQTASLLAPGAESLARATACRSSST